MSIAECSFMQVKSIAECSNFARHFRPPFSYHLGENCIRNFLLGRYIVGYTVVKVNGDARAEPLNVISEHISDDIPPQMKIWNKVSPILMHFCSFVSNWSVASRTGPKCDVINNVKYATGYTLQIFYGIQSDVA